MMQSDLFQHPYHQIESKSDALFPNYLRPSTDQDLDVETSENLFLHNSIHLIDARKCNFLDKLEDLLNENNIDFIMTEGNKESMEYYSQLDQEKLTGLIDHLPMMHI